MIGPMADLPFLPAGKLPAAALEAMLAHVPRGNPRVVVGAGLGEDAAVLDVGDRYLVVATDPITFASDRIGWYSVHVNANDVAVLGARPLWFFAVLLLPEHGSRASTAELITADIARTCAALGVSLCGGHTEITTGLERPIVIGQMLGEVEKDRLLRKDRLEVGDRILLTRGAALEGTAILAREKLDVLETRLDRAVIAAAQRLLFEPGISIVEAARIAAGAGRVRAMHDPTEGGVVTGIWELARAGGRGVRVSADAVPILPETRAVCDVLGLDPLRLIASGALLVAAEAGDAAAIGRALEAQGIPAVDIGDVRPAEEGMRIEVSGRWHPLEPADRDEIARVFARP
jgi:hydrogenase expression/formation protein HypE